MSILPLYLLLSTPSNTHTEPMSHVTHIYHHLSLLSHSHTSCPLFHTHRSTTSRTLQHSVLHTQLSPATRANVARHGLPAPIPRSNQLLSLAFSPPRAVPPRC